MKLIYGIVAAGMLFTSCKSKTSDESLPVSDTAAIASGEAIFKQDCSACHTFDRDAIGPRLGGVTASATGEWIISFISDPKKMIDSGDERANKLYDRFKTIMPAFSQYDKEKMQQIFAFLKSKEGVAKEETADDPNALKDPIPEKIAMSDLIAELKLVANIPFSSEEKPRTRIVKLEVQPGTNNLFVLDQRGKLYTMINGKASVYFDMAAHMPAFINKPGLATGFGSIAFHPEFVANGLMYTTHTEPAGSRPADFGYADSILVTLQWVLTEWKTSNPAQTTFSGEGRELLRINMVTGMHGVQEVTFNPYAKRGGKDYGMLYVGIGDGACVEYNFPELVRHQLLWGSIIRIDPKGSNSKNGKYGIPADNPFAQKQSPEVYAFGFRNPHHITWLRSGTMLASNIGQHEIESYSIIKSGADYGWPIREGSFLHNEKGNINVVYPLAPDDAKAGITYPIIQYDHDEGNAMSDGFEYLGTAVPLLKGKFLYGDIPKGRLFFSNVNEMTEGKQAVIHEFQVSVDGKLTTMEKLCGDGRVDVRIGRDAKGELYIFTKPDGKIYQVTGAHLTASAPTAAH
ncbi:PQQ-dependent sugar dehydrogenase [Chryseolinea sp. T2]|uniref:PQQ-dependent sugar dehydrogenase n=1 Tax=Chryseolinea sp. T2 TaxID=3129255 RepID=UPI00307716E3